MKFLKMVFQNFKSYGNKKVVLNFEKDFNGDLVLLTGKNGFGKCLSPDTQIDIELDDDLGIEFLNFLNESTDSPP